MISHEPDEDADRFDDEAVLESCPSFEARELDVAKPTADVPCPVFCSDWPSTRPAGQGLGLEPDAETTAWLERNSVGSRPAAAAVFRAWIMARAAKRPFTEPSE